MFPQAMNLAWIALALLLTGCAVYAGPGPFTGPGPDGAATFQSPTGELWHCVNRTAEASFLGGVIGGVSAGNAYADCKTMLEDKGYLRTREALIPKRADAASEAEKNFCRQRANSSGGGRDAWHAEYWRCLAGY